MPKSRVRKGRKQYTGGQMSKAELREVARELGAAILTVSHCTECHRTFEYFNDATPLPACPKCGAPWW